MVRKVILSGILILGACALPMQASTSPRLSSLAPAAIHDGPMPEPDPLPWPWPR